MRGIALSKHRKIEVLTSGLPYKNTPALNTLRGIRREQGRVYRGVASNRIASDEGTRRIFILDKMRVGLLSEMESESRSQLPGGKCNCCVKEVYINGVPSGEYLPKEEINRLNSQFDPPPLEEHPPSRPMLKVFSDEDTEPEPEPEPLPPAV